VTVSKGVSETVEVENRHTARGQNPPDLRDRQLLMRNGRLSALATTTV
jgi:hypothetical protein